jgi:hypothetical protein
MLLAVEGDGLQPQRRATALRKQVKRAIDSMKDPI